MVKAEQVSISRAVGGGVSVAKSATSATRTWLLGTGFCEQGPQVRSSRKKAGSAFGSH